ncbi:glycosyltransferase family 4 protein [Candidatus Sumerlaeota bacterium]|nr:glycosyltransferase family 4 protein [Candidatus Sumerlaeota bacterium]
MRDLSRRSFFALMRILLVTDNYLPHLGGSRVYYHNLLSRLDGFETLVLTRRIPGWREFDSAQPYKIRRCRIERAEWLRPLRLQFVPLGANLLLQTFRAARRFRPDVILTGELVPTGPPVAIVAAMLGKPLVAFTHAEEPSTISRTRIQSRLARRVCCRARVVVAASENARSGLTDLLRAPADRIEVLLPAVADEHFDPRYAACPLSDPARGPRLLSVGRLVERKGHATVLEALPTVLKEFPSLRYRIVGTGPLAADLAKQAAQLGLGEVVRLEGRVDGESLLRAFAESDCYVLPNFDIERTGDTEGFGIAFAEASAHGLPVVGGNAGGTSQSILDGQTGLRVDGRDPECVARAILRLLRDPESARRMGAEGREHASTEFRWPSRIEALKDILRRAAARR